MAESNIAQTATSSELVATVDTASVPTCSDGSAPVSAASAMTQDNLPMETAPMSLEEQLAAKQDECEQLRQLLAASKAARTAARAKHREQRDAIVGQLKRKIAERTYAYTQLQVRFRP